jgi:RHS repeat-associated protein
MTDALGHVTTYEYDDLGRMAKTIFHDQTFRTQEYDKLGRRVAAIDQNGKRTEYRYDDLGRLTGVKDARNQWTEYGYNEIGQLIFQEDANDNRTYYEYDILGRREAVQLPLNQRSGMTYDEVGNLKTMTDFNGKTITYLYDYQNRLTEKQFQDGSKVQYGYTLHGLQDTVTFRDSTGLITSFYDYDYDERDRLTQRTDTIGGTSRSIQYGYDQNSNQTSVTTASGITTYSYDERDRLDVTKFNGAIVADYDYDAGNRLTKTTFGNGTEEVRVYDTLNRLKELTSKKGAIELSKYVYTLDQVGNRKTAIESVNGQGRSINYTYDDLYRLTEEAIVDGVNGNRTSGYTYDNVGNRLTKTVNGVTTTYSYDGNDRLLNEKVGGATTATYTYDNNGSTLTKTENGVTTTYTWNDEKRLISATVGTQTVDYAYNDRGIRVSSKQGGVETRYLLDEGIVANVWEEYAPDGTVQASYVYGNDLITQTQAGQTSYYLVDGLGSTRLLTDSAGQVLNSYGYEAFGQTISQSGTASNKYQYAGEQFDAALGDYYLRQRFYDTSSGRFGRMDKYEGDAFSPLTLNRYIYTNANPIMGTDPSGFETIGSLLDGMRANGILSSQAYVGIAKLSATSQTVRAIAWFFTLLAVSVTAYILDDKEMEEWELDATPNKRKKVGYDYKLFPMDEEQRQDIDKDRQNANQMRVQAQTELEEGADVGIALFGNSKIGVTKAQVAAGLTSLWDLRSTIPFMRKKYMSAFQESLGLAWKDTQRASNVSGAREQVANREWDKNGNIVKKPAKGPNRVDVENLRGTNLRS